LGISVPESLPAFGHQIHIDMGRWYMVYEVGKLEMLGVLEVVKVVGKTERKGVLHRMQRLSVIVAKNSEKFIKKIVDNRIKW